MVQILFNAQRQKLPGRYFHQKIDMEIPDFSYINQREQIASGADSEIDIHGGAAAEQWKVYFGQHGQIWMDCWII